MEICADIIQALHRTDLQRYLFLLVLKWREHVGKTLELYWECLYHAGIGNTTSMLPDDSIEIKNILVPTFSIFSNRYFEHP